MRINVEKKRKSSIGGERLKETNEKIGSDV